MEAHEAMMIRDIAIGYLQHAIACIGLDDMDDFAAILVLNNCKKSLEKMDSAEQLEYQQMLETLSYRVLLPVIGGEYGMPRMAYIADELDDSSRQLVEAPGAQSFARFYMRSSLIWPSIGTSAASATVTRNATKSSKSSM